MKKTDPNFFETWVCVDEFTQHHIPEEGNMLLARAGSEEQASILTPHTKQLFTPISKVNESCQTKKRSDLHSSIIWGI